MSHTPGFTHTLEGDEIISYAPTVSPFGTPVKLPHPAIFPGDALLIDDVPMVDDEQPCVLPSNKIDRVMRLLKEADGLTHKIKYCRENAYDVQLRLDSERLILTDGEREDLREFALLSLTVRFKAIAAELTEFGIELILTED